MSAAEDVASVADFVRWANSRFVAAELCFGHGTDNPWDEAVALVLDALSVPRDKAEVAFPARLTRPERVHVTALIERRIRDRVPVPYLTGRAWFCGLPFAVTAGVVIPRSPIGELIERGFTPWLARSPERILDLGTGSGCIGIACARAFPDARVTLVDVDDTALDLACRNAAALAVDERVDVIRSDLFAGLDDTRFDLIVSNPPYVDAEDLATMPAEYRHEPARGLDGGADGLDLVARLLAHAGTHLREDGVLVVEVGNSMTALAARFPALPFTWPDLERGGHGVFVLEAAALAGLSSPDRP